MGRMPFPSACEVESQAGHMLYQWESLLLVIKCDWGVSSYGKFLSFDKYVINVRCQHYSKLSKGSIETLCISFAAIS